MSGASAGTASATPARPCSGPSAATRRLAHQFAARPVRREGIGLIVMRAEPDSGSVGDGGRIPLGDGFYVCGACNKMMQGSHPGGSPTE
jgi:hypothetical protein